ncbi:MAG: hypothetical protein U0869_16430 [Chloroflexota bacterium]
MKRHRIDVFPDRLVMEYLLTPDEVMQVFTHVGELRAEGWRMLSLDSQTVTLTDRGDWWVWIKLRKSDATHLRYTILFERVDDAPSPAETEAAG